jgi:hypothetical protein
MNGFSKKITFVKLIALVFFCLGVFVTISNCYDFYQENKVIATKYVYSNVVEVYTRTEHYEVGGRPKTRTAYITAEQYELNGKTIEETFRYYEPPTDTVKLLAVSEDECTWYLDDGYEDSMGKILGIVLGVICIIIGGWTFKRG